MVSLVWSATSTQDSRHREDVEAVYRAIDLEKGGEEASELH